MTYELVDLNDNSFTLNGAPKTKVYHMKPGTDEKRVTLINSYDSTDVLFRNVHVDDITIDGNTYENSSDAMLAFEELKKKVAEGGGNSSTSLEGNALAFTTQLMFNLSKKLNDQKLVILTDSTGVGFVGWPTLLADYIATMFPFATVRKLYWNTDTEEYDEPTLASGGNEVYLDFYIAAVSGQGLAWGNNFWEYVIPSDANLVMISYGHNDNYVSQEDYYKEYFKLIKNIRSRQTSVELPIVLIGQNPKEQSEEYFSNGVLNVNSIIKLAGKEKLGFINVMEKFFENDNYATELLSDGTHPNEAGIQLYLNTIKQSFQERNYLKSDIYQSQVDSIFIPATQMYTEYEVREQISLAGDVRIQTITCPDGQTTRLSGGIQFPKHWEIVDMYVYWMSDAVSPSANSVYFNHYCYSLFANFNPVLDSGSGTWVQSGNVPAAGKVAVTKLTSVYGVSADYKPQAKELPKYFSVTRLGSAVQDTCTDSIKILGVEFKRAL